MPFKSKAQRGYMFANMPEMAKRWAHHTPKGKKLPEHVHHKKGGLLSSFTKDAGLGDKLQGLAANVGRMTSQMSKKVGIPEVSDWIGRAHEDMTSGIAPTTLDVLKSFFKQSPSPEVQAAAVSALKAKPDFYKGVAKAMQSREAAVGRTAIGAGTAAIAAPVLHNAFTDSQLPQETSLDTGKGGPADESQKTSEFLGTPFTDGFLQCCLDAKLSGEQVANVLEKAAAGKDRPGEECRGFIQRMTV